MWKKETVGLGLPYLWGNCIRHSGQCAKRAPTRWPVVDVPLKPAALELFTCSQQHSCSLSP